MYCSKRVVVRNVSGNVSQSCCVLGRDSTKVERYKNEEMVSVQRTTIELWTHAGGC